MRSIMAETKKRGRPPLSAEKKAESIAKRKAYKKEYRSNHPEVYKGRFYEPKIRIPISNKEKLQSLLFSTGLSISQIFIDAVREKYDIDLSK